VCTKTKGVFQHLDRTINRIGCKIITRKDYKEFASCLDSCPSNTIGIDHRHSTL
jgi:hypothetical protein